MANEMPSSQQYNGLSRKVLQYSEGFFEHRESNQDAGLLYLELEERNSRAGVMDVSNTVTIYEFNPAEELVKLDVYVMPLGKRS